MTAAAEPAPGQAGSGPPDPVEQELAERLRAFNRFYTELIGSLDDDHEGLPVTLGQARMLYTVAELDGAGVKGLADRLGLDLAYVSRTLGRLEDDGLLRREIDPTDRRQRIVTLTGRGRELLGRIEARSNERMGAAVAHLDLGQRTMLLGAMATIRSLLGKDQP